jgi:uncharacterized membrane protein YbhN (UPF0104 family)
MTASMREKFSSFLTGGKWKDALKIALAILLMGIVLSRTSLDQIVALKGYLSWPWLVISFGLFCLMTLVKTLQYWALLGGRASYRQTLKIVIIQNALTNYVAGTAGLASYLAMFQMDQNVKARHSGAVFLLTKAGDLLSMGLFLLVSASLVWTRVRALHELAILILTGVGLGLAAFWVAVFFRQPFVRFLRGITHRLRVERLSLVARGLSALESLSTQDSQAVLRIFFAGGALSLAYMIATLVYGYSRVQTFQIPLDFWAIIFISSLMQFVSIIPFQVFGGLGVTEVSLIYLYGLFGVTQDIPAILIGLRVLFYLFNLALLAYVPLETFFARSNSR